MTFKALVQKAVAEIELLRSSWVPEEFEMGYEIFNGFELFIIKQEITHNLQFFDKDRELNRYYCLHRVIRDLESKDEKLILAVPGGESYPLVRLKNLPLNKLFQIGPFKFSQKTNHFRQRVLGILAKDIKGNVFLSNSIKFNSKDVRSAIKFGLAIIDNYNLTDVALSSFYHFDFFGIGMKSNGDIIIVSKDYYATNSEWIDVFVSYDCCDAAIIYTPNAEYFLRNFMENSYLKTYGGFIGYTKKRKDIKALIWEEIDLVEQFKYFLLSR